MKLLFPALLCLLLLGCSAPTEPAKIPTDFPAAAFSEETEQLRAHYSNAAEVISLPAKNVDEIFSSDRGLLLRSGRDLILTDETGSPTAEYSVEFEPRILSRNGVFSLFDPTARQVLLLDDSLTETRRITLPEDLSGEPVFSSDGNTLYYCTSGSIYGWDLESGIRRRILESSYEDQTRKKTGCGICFWMPVTVTCCWNWTRLLPCGLPQTPITAASFPAVSRTWFSAGTAPSPAVSSRRIPLLRGSSSRSCIAP